MTVRRFLSLILACCAVTAVTGYAQTHAQLLEKAIYSEETAGDLDSAVRLYRQIVASQQAPRDVVALAELRLANTLRRTQRPQATPSAAGAAQDTAGCCGLFSNNYDPSQQVTVVGIVRAVQWINPQSVLIVDGADGNTWGFTIAAPNAMIRSGMNKDTFRLNDQLLITGFLATGVAEKCPATLPTACSKLMLPRPDGQQVEIVHASAGTITSDHGTRLFDRAESERLLASQQR